MRLVFSSGSAGGVGGAVGWGEPRAMASRRGRGEEVRSAAQHVPPPDWWTSGLWGTVGGKIS